jgi:O-antigen/teichoic acid export membrane protein
MRNTDIIMVGCLLGMAEAGIYGAASRISGFIAFGLTASNTAFSPLISEQLVTGTTKTLSAVVTRATMCIVALTLPIIVAVLLLGQPILSVFGHSFTQAYPVLAIMCLGHFVNAMCGSVGLIMNLSGLEWKATRILAASALANLVLHAFLITAFGVLGAATATTISLSLWNLWMLMVIRREIGVDPSICSVSQVLLGKTLPTPS